MKRRLFIIACLLMVGVPNGAHAAARNFAFESTRYGLSLPASISASVAHADDYSIYTFKRNGRVLLQAYIGNSPIDTVFKEHRQYATFDPVSAYPAESIVYTYPGDIQSREIILTLDQGAAWPKFAHFWYLNLSAPDAAIADSIVQSIGTISGEDAPRFAVRQSRKSEVWGAPGSWGAQAQRLLRDPVARPVKPTQTGSTAHKT